MDGAVQDWVEKAEADYHSALRERRARKHVNHDSTCFHAQQCIEKYMKAILVRHHAPFAKTHDLVPLLKLCGECEPLLGLRQDELEWLTQFAILFRYPGETATRDDAQKAIRIMRAHRKQLRATLALPDSA